MHAAIRYGLLGAMTVAGAATWVPPTDAVPAYYTGAPKLGHHPLLSGDQLTGPYFTHGFQITAYKMAAKIEGVLYQQPCYCRCDLALHHRSLHSCFEGTHGAVCATCMRQAVYAYQQTQLGKTPEEIRAAIERGDWRDVQLEEAKLGDPVKAGEPGKTAAAKPE